MIIVTGRSDAILPISHTSRSYYGLNQIVESARSNTRYYEITNAHHLDVFDNVPVITQAPGDDAIKFDGNILRIPD